MSSRGFSQRQVAAGGVDVRWVKCERSWSETGALPSPYFALNDAGLGPHEGLAGRLERFNSAGSWGYSFGDLPTVSCVFEL